MDDMTAALETWALTRRYGRRTAVADVSLRLPAGRVACLLGANGAGKSTLLALAAGVLTPDAGHVSVLGRRLDASPQARGHLGYMADTPLVYEALSGQENLAFYARLYGLKRPGERIRTLLNQVGLSNRAADAVATYSAGMRRRLDLARTMLHEPQVLLLDEPAGALDADGRQMLAEMLAACRADGRAVLLSAHDESAAPCEVDDVLHIDRGRLKGDRAAIELTSSDGEREA